jgi:plastocyanin
MKSHARRSLLSAAVLGVAAALVLVGCGGSSSTGGGGTSPTPAAAATSAGGGGGASDVTIANFAFTPQTLSVKTGTKVTWTNNDSVPHTVVSTDSMSTSANTTNLFASNTLSPGQSFSFTFDKAGTYFYECSIHFSQAAMHGKVVVK